MTGIDGVCAEFRRAPYYIPKNKNKTEKREREHPHKSREHKVRQVPEYVEVHKQKEPST
jgi:hypothetical protein